MATEEELGAVEGTMAPSRAMSSQSSATILEGGNVQTLDEPVCTTITRDLRRVGAKLRLVLMPAGSQADMLKELRDWDLWGPLLLCLALSIVLSLSASEGQKALVFASVFVLVWVGAAVITANALLLGGKM